MAWHSSHKEIGHKQKMAGESANSTAAKETLSEEITQATWNRNRKTNYEPKD
jgi:hypothetical protein